MCSTSTELADADDSFASEATSDWAHFLNVSIVEAQGDLPETFHPNAYGAAGLGLLRRSHLRPGGQHEVQQHSGAKALGRSL